MNDNISHPTVFMEKQTRCVSFTVYTTQNNPQGQSTSLKEIVMILLTTQTGRMSQTLQFLIDNEFGLELL